MAFEVFTKRLVPLAKAPYVTLQKRGTISLNKSAADLIGEPEAVELLYDSDSSIIGFKAVEPTVEHAYAIRQMGGQDSVDRERPTTYMVSGVAFLKYHGVDTSQAKRYPAYLNNDAILCVDLKTEGTIVTSNREGKAKKAPPPKSYGR